MVGPNRASGRRVGSIHAGFALAILLSLILACLSFLGAIGLEWKKIKGHGPKNITTGNIPNRVET
jgi:hypothetical protein